MRRAVIICGPGQKFARCAKSEGRGDMGSFWLFLMDSQQAFCCAAIVVRSAVA